MESTIDVLKNRRSVKSFKDNQISKEDLESILSAAKNAPSGMNLQSPKILVIQRKKIIERLSQWNKSFYPKEIVDSLPDDFDPFYNAPTLLIILVDKNVNTCVEDGSLVIGNILNAASSLGIGSCWIHRAREEFDSLQGKELLKVWGLSEDYIGVGHVVLGYPNDEFTFNKKEIKEDYVVYVDDLI
ncbi:MAG: nitroreductase [Methanosphaera sp.]|nr:nitroreductase [Methanosphaera sp.]